MSTYTTTTASLKATTANIRDLDAKSIKLNGEQIPSKVLDDRGDFVTDQDLWGTTVTTDENGVVHVSHKFLSNPNGSSAWNRSVYSVKDNKAYTSTDASGDPLCNIQTEMINDGTKMFHGSSIRSFSSDLSNLTNGKDMFSFSTSFTSFSGDLSNLINGDSMFSSTKLTSFRGDLSSLTNGNHMFSSTKLTSFNGDLSNLNNGRVMFQRTSLTFFNGDLSNLVNGDQMFCETPLTSFIGYLSSLINGSNMFRGTSLTLFNGNNMFGTTSLDPFNGDLSNLTNGYQMFRDTPLTSFSGNLSSLIYGSEMFYNTSLTSFDGDLSSLPDGESMFQSTSLTSFNSDLSSLVIGDYMFSNTHKRGYTISHYKMVDGVSKEVTEHFRAEGLTSFSGDLSSLQSGYGMFGTGGSVSYTNEEGVTETTKNITPLDEQSIMIIADTIKDLNGFTDWSDSVYEENRGYISLGYDSAVCDAAKIEEYCTEIMNKGWTVYLNGTVQTTDEGIEGIATADEDGTITVTPVPYYCKPVEVDQKNAEWTDGEKYYIIRGAQKVFGDDLSTYGMFTSIEDAAMNMGFTPYEYVEEETETVEEN